MQRLRPWQEIVDWVDQIQSRSDDYCSTANDYAAKTSEFRMKTREYVDNSCTVSPVNISNYGGVNISSRISDLNSVYTTLLNDSRNPGIAVLLITLFMVYISRARTPVLTVAP